MGLLKIYILGWGLEILIFVGILRNSEVVVSELILKNTDLRYK